MGRSLLPLQLTLEEKSRLTDWAREQTTTQALAVRARIVLECSRGSTNTQVSRRLRIPMQTVGKWRRRFTVRRLEGLLDAPRPGRPRAVSDAKIEEVLALTLARNPQAPMGWNSRLMAKATGVNQTAIVRIWKTLGMQVRRVETFELISEQAKEAQKVGEVDSKLKPEQLAGALLSAWEGPLLRARVAGDAAPLKEFMAFGFGRLIG